MNTETLILVNQLLRLRYSGLPPLYNFRIKKPFHVLFLSIYAYVYTYTYIHIHIQIFS